MTEQEKGKLEPEVRELVEKAKRGETLTKEEAGRLGGHDVELKEFGVEEPSDRKKG